jgi:hypothetical protein
MNAPAWQAAEALILVAETGGPAMFARIGIRRALNRHRQPAPEPHRKRAKAYRIAGKNRRRAADKRIKIR